MSGSGSTFAQREARTCQGFVTNLVVRCGQGDDAALGELYELFHPLVGSLAVRRAPDREVTEVVLEAFARVWQHARSFEPSAGSAVAWVLLELAAAVQSAAAASTAPCGADHRA